MLSKIKTDRVSFDGYEVHNLVSSNPEIKRKGFLSDHFIKPPVNVTVQFPCNVSIQRIVIDPVVGQQKSCDMKIFTAAEKMMDSWLYDNSNNDVNTEGVLFNFVGNVSQGEPTTVCFTNRQFKERNLWRIENVPDISSYPCVAHLSSRKSGGLTNVSHVTVCVTRTKGGKSVALKRLEIWGIPSMRVPNPVQLTLKKTYIAALRQNEIHQRCVPIKSVTSSANKAATDSPVSNGEEVIIDGVSVPEDFIDQITCAIMTVPVLLPSGKNVDQSTLDRYVNTEASWGRSPNDPFTAVMFSQGSGPITNSSLKARIDQFVLKHSEALKIPHTLGHSESHTHCKNTIFSSKLVPDVYLSKTACKYSLPESKTNTTKPTESCTTQETLKQEKRKTENERKLDVSQNKLLGMDQKCGGYCAKGVKRKLTVDKGELSEYHPKMRQKSLKDEDDCLCIDLTSDLEAGEVNTCTKQGMSLLQGIDHNRYLSQSLDNALLSTLGGLPSFTKKSSTKLVSGTPGYGDGTDVVCCKCRIDLRKTDVLKYRIPCAHFICRRCLLSEPSSLVCNVCFCQCKSSQAIRMF